MASEEELAEKVRYILEKIKEQDEASGESSSDLYDQLATTLDRLVSLRTARNARLNHWFYSKYIGRGGNGVGTKSEVR